jgi:hypothetical protein
VFYEFVANLVTNDFVLQFIGHFIFYCTNCPAVEFLLCDGQRTGPRGMVPEFWLCVKDACYLLRAVFFLVLFFGT